MALLLACCALQNVLVALAQFYAVDSARPLQALCASALPPIAWFAYRREALGQSLTGRSLWPLALPAAVALALAGPRLLIDPLLLLGFVLAGVALLRVVGAAHEVLPATNVGAGDRPLRLWRCIGAALVAMALVDAAISLAWQLGAHWLQPWILSFASTALLLLVGYAGSAPELAGQPSAPPENAASSPIVAADCAADRELVAALDELLLAHELYLDPELTLLQLARKLGIPDKQLSAAVNRHTGHNISRHINRYRVEHACQLLAQGESVTAAMGGSGFNTKSNFHREFKRCTGMTPTAWRAQRSGGSSDENAPLAGP